MRDIHFLSLVELASELRTGRLGAVEVTEAFLRRVEKLNPSLNAFLDPGADRAIEEAQLRDRERATGRVLGPLHGVPVAIKDIIDVSGTPTTANSRITVNECAAEDAFVVSRLRKSGAVIFGKTSLHEFATGGPSFDLPWPPARNPWNLEHHPAGSSSGSGAAVAAGLAPAALGTDTAGSVRHPGTACGVVGMKPTYGAISRHGVFPLAHSLDYVGPMTRGVADNALLFDACVGYDGKDPTSATASKPVGPLDGRISGLRIGVIEEFGQEAQAEIGAAFQNACEVLQRLGAHLVPLEVPPLKDFAECGRLIIQAESFAVHKAWLQERYSDYGWRARTKILSGAFIDAATYIQAQKLRRLLCAELADAMHGVDAVVCVSSLEHPARIEDDDAVDRTYDRQARTPFNLSGQPAIAIPTGLTADRLPLGMQIVGKAFDERTIYRIALALEQEQPWAQLWPAVAMEGPVTLSMAAPLPARG